MEEIVQLKQEWDEVIISFKKVLRKMKYGKRPLIKSKIVENSESRL